MDYIKIQTEFIKDRLNKKNKMRICHDHLHERYGILNNDATLFVMIPEDSFLIDDCINYEVFNITPILSDFDETLK